MPRYEYQCNVCQGRLVLRRSVEEMDFEVTTICCAAPAERVFTPTRSVFVPRAFQSVRANGVEGGYSWSDFHPDHSPKELAQIKELNGRKVEIVPTSELRSMAGAGQGIPEHIQEAENRVRVRAAMTEAHETLTSIATRS